MKSFFILGAAAMVAGSPAPAPLAINLGIVSAAPDVTLSGPTLGAGVQTGVYNSAAAQKSASAAVTGVATASATASQVPSVGKRGFGNIQYGIAYPSSSTKCASSTKSTTTTTSTTTTKATTTTTTTTTSTTSTTSPAITSSSSSRVVPSTCTPVSWTNTNAFITTDTSCPQPYEVGTYCGFINPEDPCAIQPDGYGPVAAPDTVDSFLGNPVLHNYALNAATPKNYSQTFKNLNASVNANSYMGLYTLTSYDVAGCAAHCDNTDLCTAFNIYIERDPAWNPDQCSCTGDQTASITNYKCTLWGSGVQPAAATNTGDNRQGFEVVIVGSNGYEKTNNTQPDTPTGWTNPKNCSSKVHDHPSTCIGEKLFKGVYDPSICATYANTQNSVNSRYGIISLFLSFFGYNPGKCNFFNAFMLTENGKASGTYCKLYSQQYEPTYASSACSWSNGKYYGVESSWSFCSA